jgi:hypothetical protein
VITITADPAVRLALTGLSEPAEIRDSDGNLLGYFTPAGREEAQLYAEAIAHLDPREMKRRKESGQPGYSTAQVLERLESREPR